MNGLFVFLFLLALVGIIVGLVRPHVFERLLKQSSSRKHLSFGFGSLIVLFLILIAVTTPKTTTLQTANTNAVIAPAVSQTNTPTVTTKTVTTTQPVAFTTTTEQDSSLAKGTNQIKVQGVNGVETQVYKVTYENGQETDRTLVSTTVTTPPVNEVIEDGTYVAPAPKPAAPAPTPSPTPASCYPLTNGGNCYEPGEYCRNSDHGATGLAGDGEPIICADNNGWRWEPN